MNKKLQVLSLWITMLIVSISSTFAQSKVITGTVISATDNFSLPGVNVIIKGTSTGTITDIDGRY